jgi:hypothetical protein
MSVPETIAERKKELQSDVRSCALAEETLTVRKLEEAVSNSLANIMLYI